MDTNGLILWTIGAVLIAIGVPLLILARYLTAPEDEKKKEARGLKVVAIVWMAAGVIIYALVLIRRFVFNA
jgi:uncharacterized membrane protein YidH (DUF202 family)